MVFLKEVFKKLILKTKSSRKQKNEQLHSNLSYYTSQLQTTKQVTEKKLARVRARESAQKDTDALSNVIRQDR